MVECKSMQNQQPFKQSQDIVIHRNDDELRGRFADTFTVSYNGDNFAVDFYTKMPRQDGKLEQILVARVFTTEKGLSSLAQAIQGVVGKIKKGEIKQLP